MKCSFFSYIYIYIYIHTHTYIHVYITHYVYKVPHELAWGAVLRFFDTGTPARVRRARLLLALA